MRSHLISLAHERHCKNCRRQRKNQSVTELPPNTQKGVKKEQDAILTVLFCQKPTNATSLVRKARQHCAAMFRHEKSKSRVEPVACMSTCKHSALELSSRWQHRSFKRTCSRVCTAAKAMSAPGIHHRSTAAAVAPSTEPRHGSCPTFLPSSCQSRCRR